MNEPLKRIEARDALVDAALAIIVAERCMAKDPAAFAAVTALDAELELRARDLVNLVSEAKPSDRPRGWDLSPDGGTA